MWSGGGGGTQGRGWRGVVGGGGGGFRGGEEGGRDELRGQGFGTQASVREVVALFIREKRRTGEAL